MGHRLCVLHHALVSHYTMKRAIAAIDLRANIRALVKLSIAIQVDVGRPADRSKLGHYGRSTSFHSQS